MFNASDSYQTSTSVGVSWNVLFTGHASSEDHRDLSCQTINYLHGNSTIIYETACEIFIVLKKLSDQFSFELSLYLQQFYASYVFTFFWLLITWLVFVLQSNQVKRTPQEYINEFIIQKLNLLLVVDFRLISAFLHV